MNLSNFIFHISPFFISNENIIEVEEPENVKLGRAKIRTVISGSTLKDYNIEIINIIIVTTNEIKVIPSLYFKSIFNINIFITAPSSVCKSYNFFKFIFIY